MSVCPVRRAPRARVLVLARRQDSLLLPAWDAHSVWWGWRAQVLPRTPWWSRARRTEAGLRSVDVVVSCDEETDRALQRVRSTVTVVPSARAAGTLEAVRAVERLLVEITDGAPLGGRLQRWARQARTIDPAALPAGALVVAEAARRVRALHGDVQGSRVLARVLDVPPWPEEERSTSGLAARSLAARLTLGELGAEDVDEGGSAHAACCAVTARTLRAADARLDAGDRPAALDLLGDVLALHFHRARHAEVAGSPLVRDPAGYLRELTASRTWADLRESMGTGQQQGAAAEGSAQRHGGGRPHVLVVTGAYGSFHQGVVEAVGDDAEVRVRDLRQDLPFLRRKVMDPDVLPALAAFGGTDEAAGLRAELGAADVIFSDWADRATVVLSHTCPPGPRLVVRVHALDALDPWFHLVRWERVDALVVPSEPMARLVADLLATTGTRLPVQVIGNVVVTPGLDRPKLAGARTTLGLVGWGRVVKCPTWALDLLEREPAWRLVLIGPDFPAHPTPATAAYVAAFRERLRAPSLRDRVHITGRTEDVAAALQQVGVILSTSNRESWHVGLVEGALSGAVPVVRDWPLLRGRGGARTLFPPGWVVDDLDQAEARIRAVTAPGAWERERRLAQEAAGRLFDPAATRAAYRDLLLGAALGDGGRGPGPLPG